MSNIKRKSYFFGIFTEYLAIIYLKMKFYTIIHNRYKTKFGEVDLIAKKGNRLIFVEVKGRRNKENIYETISEYQKNRIINASQIFLMKNSKYQNYFIRFDIFLFSPPLFFKYLEDAFGA